MSEKEHRVRVAQAQSIRDRLLNLARQQEGGVTFNALLRRYMQERLLWRLSISPHGDRFILKGALRLVAVGFPWARVTKDIDLLGFGDPSPEQMAALFRDLCRVDLDVVQRGDLDGVQFDSNSVQARSILEGAEYGGIRVSLVGQLGAAREPLHVDIGFGDTITPGPVGIEVPCLLPGMPAPWMRAYTNESTIAEKYHAMVKLGSANSRMKDFCDIYQFAASVTFDGTILAQALRTGLHYPIPTAGAAQWTSGIAERGSVSAQDEARHQDGPV